jgi:CPA2 family monovalent cation:H+ antiporter-2
MLFDPAFLISAPLKLLALLVLVVLVKGLTALAIVAALGHPPRTGLTVAAGLAQVGEFSFILAELGGSLNLLPAEGRSLILGTAILSIAINPFIFRLADLSERWLRTHPGIASRLDMSSRHVAASASELDVPRRGHAVLCGFGRVGKLIGDVLDRRGFTYVVIDQDRREVEELRRRGVAALYGDASNPLLLEHANIAHASVLVVAISDPPASRYIVEQARRLSERVRIVVRTTSEAERAYLVGRHVDDAVLADREVAAEMARYTLQRLGVVGPELQLLVQGLRHRATDE